ncbi:MAG: CRISPR-associated helicase Cas3' [Synechococcales cyanobacterium C42_A2020_086]|jgi:CRISPR-associated endonuclease/helicase Cas3|nr:CRISPR-associated helicase Cas3' [Synechococcales cyanobacterium C42_A2020_086]
MRNEIEQNFQTLIGFPPRQFQIETITKLLQLHNVLLRAPTGSGKTETAIAPFLFAKQMGVEDFPNKLIYIVPLRTLATSLRDRAVKLVKTWESVHPPKRPLVVTLQTGENPEDPRFEGDIVFCTIDQLLSSFLSIPYSVGRGSANVNAGVVFASYLVFDELHLLDPNRSFATTLKLLKQVQGVSPYLLMTATLTHELTQQVQQEVTPRNCKPEEALSLVNVEGNDLKQIEGSRQRQFIPCEEPLSAEVILRDVQQNDRKRVIVICNTVARSQSLFQNLRDIAPETIKIVLLHARFLPEDRKQTEAKLQRIFAKNWTDDGLCYVLISTQVIEAGINITSQVMHTQLCPMNALLQRAGRCARFADETGQVLVYRQMRVSDKHQGLAASEDDDEAIAQTENRKRRQFLPYSDKTCELTWTVLLEHRSAGRVDLPVGFAIEEAWINNVHGEEDRVQAGKRLQNRSQFELDFDDAVFRGKRHVAENLIRQVDNRSVFMVEDAAIIDLDISEDVDVRQLQPFSLPRTTLIKLWREYVDSHHQTWLFKKVESESKSAEGYVLPKAKPIKTQQELTESIRLVVNPSYVSYDSDIGLQIGVHIQGHYRSPKKPKSKVSKEYSYKMDTYLGHLGRIWTCWERDFNGEVLIDGQPTVVKLSSVCGELGLAGGKFILRKFFPQATLPQTIALFEFLVFLAVITHDLGKLQVGWQSAMRGWQKTAFELYCSLSEKPDFEIMNPGNHLLAHTDHHPENEIFKKAYETYTAQHPRPSHAVESAFIAYDLLDAVLIPVLEEQYRADETQVNLIRHTIEMAAGRHHSAWAKGWEDSSATIQLHPEANKAIQQSWQQLSRRLKGKLLLPDQLPQLEHTYEMEEFSLGKEIGEADLPYQQLYWLVVRALRICDGRSVQLH